MAHFPKFMIRLAVFVFLLANSNQVLASPQATDAALTPLFMMSGIRQGELNYGDSHAGYGYVGIADTWADAHFNFRCEDTDLQQYVAQSKFPQVAGDLQTWVHSQHDPFTMALLRDSVFEFLVYEAGALNPTQRPVQLKAPACVSVQSKGIELINQLPPHNPTDEDVLAQQLPFQRDLMKFRGVWTQTRPITLAYAVLFHDLLVARMESACKDPEKQALCVDLKYRTERVRATFSLLFSDTNAPAYVKSIRDSMIKVFGAESISRQTTDSPDYTAKNLTEEGTKTYVLLMQSKDLSGYETFLRATLKHVLLLKAPVALRLAFKALIEQGEAFWGQKRSSLQAEADAICDLDLSTLVAKYQNVVRQTLINISEQENRTLRSTLCLNGSFKQEQIPVDCNGVTGTPLPGPGTISVARKTSEFPYTNRSIISITQPQTTDPIEFHLKIYFSFDSDISSEIQKQTLSKWQHETSAWYACQTGSIQSTYSLVQSFGDAESDIHPFTQACPAGIGMEREPRVKFDFQFTNDLAPFLPAQPDGVIVAVHKCYREEIGSSDCNAVRDFAVARCTAGAKGDADKIQTCQALKAGDPANNRANSGNFMLDSKLGTIFHESGHLLGLDDEYLDPTMPFGLLGYTSSIMNKSKQKDPRLDWTQIERMLQPLRCVKQ